MRSKGFGKQIYLVGAVVLALIFVLAIWSSISPFLESAFDTVFSLGG